MAEFALPVPKVIVKRQWGWMPHTKRPDVDKLARALLDPLKGIVWKDDSQVCFLTVNKVYAWEKRYGAMVIIDFLTDEWCERYGAAHDKVADVLDTL